MFLLTYLTFRQLIPTLFELFDSLKTVSVVQRLNKKTFHRVYRYAARTVEVGVNITGED